MLANGTLNALAVAEVVTVTLVAFVAVVAVVADVALPDSVAVIVPALKLPEPSRATSAEAVLALVAFDVTVNDEAPDWFAVNVADPERPTPDTAIVRVPLLTLAAVVAVVAFPDSDPDTVPTVSVLVLGLYVNSAAESCRRP